MSVHAEFFNAVPAEFFDAARGGDLETVKRVADEATGHSSLLIYRNFIEATKILETAKKLVTQAHACSHIDETVGVEAEKLLETAKSLVSRARAFSNDESAKLLDIKDRAGPVLDTAFNLAADNGHPNVARWIAWYKQVECEEAMCMAAWSGHLDLVKRLAAYGGVDPKNYGRAAALAACEGHLAVVQWLDENGQGVLKEVVNHLVEVMMNEHTDVWDWTLQRVNELKKL